MRQTHINGYQVTIFSGYYGTQLFINHADGYSIYAHRIGGGEQEAMERARQIIALETPAMTETVAPVAEKMICLSNRKQEFRAAMKRGLSNEFVVRPGSKKDSFIVRNLTNKTEYQVKFETRADGKNYGHCTCKDFQCRKNLCKHLSETLMDTFFGAVESFGVTLNG